MNAEHNLFFDLAERIKVAYSEIDSDIVTDLFKTNSEYSELRREVGRLERDFPVLETLMEDGGTISLSAEEHTALVRCLGLKQQMENMERRQIYFRGHTDCFAYLKRIGAI